MCTNPSTLFVSGLKFLKRIKMNASAMDDLVDFNYTIPEPVEPEKSPINIAAVIAYAVFAVVGVIGNVWVICVVLCNKQMRHLPMYLLIVNLAVTHLLISLTNLPILAVVYAIAQWPFGDVICKANGYLYFVTSCMTAYTIVIMSVERFLAASRPVSATSIRAWNYVVVILWAVILLVNVPFMLLYEVKNFHTLGASSCIQKIAYSRIAAIALQICAFVLIYAIPFAIIVVLYGLTIFCRICKHGSQVGENVRRETVMMAVVAGVFFVCCLPVSVLNVIQSVSYVDNMIIPILLALLGALHSCINPFLYICLSKEFRKYSRNVCCC